MLNTSPWQFKIPNADKFYKEWENLFMCKTLEKYYEGFQWNLSAATYRPYTLNLIYSTIKIKMAAVIYQRPKFVIESTPGKMDWNQQFAVESAQIKEDTLNTLINNPRVHFADHLKLAALDSFFRFGILEVGYAADWQNPNKIPYVKVENEENNLKEAQLEVPSNERIYFKHIRASRFRVAVEDATDLDNCHWCGYYSWMYKSDLQKTKGINLPKEYRSKFYASDYGDIAASFDVENGSPEMWQLISSGQVCKVWHIWDNYNKKKLLVLNDNYEVIWEDFFERLPFPNIRWDLRAPSREDKDSSGWYPIPPVFNWLAPQDEVNKAREQMRNYRKRFTRKFGYVKGAIDANELDKFTNEQDGAMIEFKRAGAIEAIGNPEIGISITESLTVSMQDLNLVTGTPAPARAQADRQTATATKEAAAHERIRESIEQIDFASFIIAAGREGLLQIKERFTEGMWIKSAVDPGGDFLAEVQDRQAIWKYVTVQEIDDGYDEDITLDVVNASPEKMLEEEGKFLKFIGLLNQFPQISMDPDLIIEAAYKVGYRNLKIIRKVQQAAQLQMMAQMQQMQGQLGQQSQGGGMGPVQQGMIGNSNPNPMSEIESQLQGQVG